MADWFIARNGQQEGPLSEQAVRMFITSGQLKSEDVVWQQGMNEWTPAGRVPELAGLFQTQTPAPAAAMAAAQPQFQQPTIGYASQSSVGRNPVLTDRALDMLRKTKPWARLFGVLIFIGAGLMALFGVLMIGAGVLGAAAHYGSSASDVFGSVVGGALNLAFSVLYLMPGVYLNRYASRIADLLQGGREDQVEQALEAQKSFWKFVGISALLTVVLWIAVMFILVVAFAIGVSSNHPTPQPFPNAPQIPAVPPVPTR